MIAFNPFQLAEWTGGFWHSSLFPESVNGFCFDARQLEAGQCFVALSGGARDGHAFCAQAMAQGAGALLVERAQALSVPQLVVKDTLQAMAAIATAHRANFSGPVVGVTGSCGKTSTKEMLRQVLGTERTHATAGNWNNLIGVPMTLFGLDASVHQSAVVEAGINQPGEMARLGEMIRPDVSVVTMIGPAHLELLGSLEGVAAEKSELVAASKGLIVLPASVLAYPAFSRFADRAIVLAAVDEVVPSEVRRCVRYEIQTDRLGGTRLTLRRESEEHSYWIQSPSVGIALNAGLAILAAEALAVNADQIRSGIESWTPAGNRGRVASVGEQTFYIDCYNANPSSMIDALCAFDIAIEEVLPRCYVLGAMNELGQKAEDLHHAVTRVLQLRPQDAACFIGPESLTSAYQRGAMDAGAQPEQIRIAEKSAALKSFVDQFKGAIFLKGSRSYALESLLPDSLR